jgi:hypothetical protein
MLITLSHIVPNMGGGDWSILASVDSKQNVKNSKYESIPQSFYQMIYRRISTVTQCRKQ